METVELVHEGYVATLRFANPPKHTLTAGMVTAMQGHVAALAAAKTTRVLVIRSATPNVFITHYEVGELTVLAERIQSAPSNPAPPNAEPLYPLHELTLSLEALPCVTVAAMDGLATGGGLELALGCDFRLLCDGLHVVSLPETGIGIIPGAGGTQRFVRLLGIARALDLILFGTTLTPKDALATGLVHRVFPADVFDAEVKRFVASLAARAPIALAQAKLAIRKGSELPLRDALRVEQTAFAATLSSADARNAMHAYLKGQPYTFKGE